jgi:hypothetical protein
MVEIINQRPEIAQRREAARAHLAIYGLTDADQAALARQGFVIREPRGRNTIIYKLRYRLDGQQRVRYIGTETHEAERVQQSVNELQTERRLELAIGRLNREAAQLLRDGKQRLEGPLAAAGFRFHGRAIRRRRAAGDTV